jgi:hypothetical protein
MILRSRKEAPTGISQARAGTGPSRHLTAAPDGRPPPAARIAGERTRRRSIDALAGRRTVGDRGQDRS